MLIDRPANSHDRAFTYALPEHLRECVTVGSYVLVPFGKQQLPGFVVGLTDSAPLKVRVREVLGPLLDYQLFGAPMMALARWLAERYACALSDTLRLLLPPGGSRKTRRMVAVTPAGSQAGLLFHLARAPRQQAVLRQLQSETGPVPFDRLLRALQRGDQRFTAGSLESALSALGERGYTEVIRELQRPAVQPIERQVARLVARDDAYDDLLLELQEKAPRQAEVIATLLAADDLTASVADLPRAAVTALIAKGLVEVTMEVQEREPLIAEWNGASSSPLQLSEDQQAVYREAEACLESGCNAELLIHGVTGSGKTEVYLHCVALALRQGGSAIVLVPEIALTPQMVGRFKARFGDVLAVLHSGLGQGERFDEWRRIQRGEARVVVGARSALFAPARDLALVIVDEEHESAYKQDQPPRYRAVEVARERARLESAVLLLGSATPDVVDYHEARSGRSSLRLLELPNRIGDRPLPTVEVLDLRGQVLSSKDQVFSQQMLGAIAQRLEANEQVMLFLNRRGFATFIMCRECGHVMRCPDCDVSLTYHHQSHTIRCHHCDYARHVPEQCPGCQGYEIGFHGLGTERVADQLSREFPEAVVARMDRDTIAHKGAHGRILTAFANGDSDVLVGTQMIAKGHDFPRVTLVGVLNADTGLHRPDFRSAEVTFQVLTQMAGRAGRADRPGEVLVQSYNPEHYAVVAASHHDYLGFYEREMRHREKNLYPPFVRLARLVLSSEDEGNVAGESRRFAALLRDMGVPERAGDTHYLGPAEAPLRKLRGRYRHAILLKSIGDGLPVTVAEALARFTAAGDLQIAVDMDPLDMM